MNEIFALQENISLLLKHCSKTMQLLCMLGKDYMAFRMNLYLFINKSPRNNFADYENVIFSDVKHSMC